MARNEIARLLINSRVNKVGINVISSYLNSLSNGYSVQNEIIELNDKKLGHLIGWKIGATNTSAQKLMGFGPFYGPLFESNFINYSSNEKMIISLND